MKWELRIRKVENGYIVEKREEGEPVTEVAFSDRREHISNSQGDDLESMVELLRFVMEHFGIYHSKHEKHNIRVDIEGEGENTEKPFTMKSEMKPVKKK